MGDIGRRWRLAGGPYTLPTALAAWFNGQDGDGIYAIGEASQAAAAAWVTNVANPVIQKSGAGWVSDHVKDPWVMPGALTIYVSGYNGSKYQIGRLTRATTASAWAYDNTTTPAIALGASGANDDGGCLFPVVLDEPGDPDASRRWKMWYTGHKLSDGRFRVMLATSPDGTQGSWTKRGTFVDVGSSGTWDDEGVVSAAIYKAGATYYLFAGGTSRPGGDFFWQGGAWTFTDPEGVYAPLAGNPTLTYIDASDPAASQPLGSTAASGVTVVHPADTSHYVGGQAVVLGDTTSETEIHSVASIDSSTQVTLREATASAFTAADSARLRPFDYLSVQPRTVRAIPTGGFEMYVAVFQPVADVAFGGTTSLREGSLRYTSTTIDGTWIRDDTTGLLFPMYPANTGWDKFSAENPSVIAAP